MAIVMGTRTNVNQKRDVRVQPRENTAISETARIMIQIGAHFYVASYSIRGSVRELSTRLSAPHGAGFEKAFALRREHTFSL
jgi:hypothetical protein